MNPLHAIVEKARTVRSSERVAQLVQLVMPQRVPAEGHPGFSFSQLHIDVARNAIGDFNPFHDPVKWRRIQGNPFGGPIVMGFQLEMLLLEATQRRRSTEEPAAGGAASEFRYARFSFNFADVIHADEPVEVDIRPSRWRTEEGGSISNRVSLRRQERVVLMGQLQAGNRAALGPGEVSGIPRDIETLPDGSRWKGGRCFLKKKILQISDAKNFLAGSLVPHHPYFDELEGRALFPELFPVSLISSALLEKAASEGYDFLEDPMVYTSHAFSVDRSLLRQLANGDSLFILVDGPEEERSRRGSGMLQSRYRCTGLLAGNRILFQAETRLASLQELQRVRQARDA